MGSRYALLGEAPNRQGHDKHLECHLAVRAAGHQRLTRGTYSRAVNTYLELRRFCLHCSHVNVLDHYPGRDGRGAKFPMEEARIAASILLPQLLVRHRLVLLAGRRVARACGVKDGWEEYFVERGGIMLVPHPSGINRWWNEPGNQQLALQSLRRLGRLAHNLSK